MRANIYAEELTDEVELITKKLDDGRVFYGIRLYLESPAILHKTKTDDDRSGVTFWVPWTAEQGNIPGALSHVFGKLLGKALEIPAG